MFHFFLPLKNQGIEKGRGVQQTSKKERRPKQVNKKEKGWSRVEYMPSYPAARRGTSSADLGERGAFSFLVDFLVLKRKKRK